MFSKRVKSIKPFMVMEILARALEMEREGKHVIHMEIGEPDFDTPPRIINGCFNDVKEGKTHYTDSLGFLDLRTAISEYKYKIRGIKYEPKTQIMITGGTSPAFFNVLSCIINPGDEVIISDPTYPCYVNFITFFGGIPVYIPIKEENQFNLEVKPLEKAITSKTKAIILNSPSNPTGQIIPEETLDIIFELVAANNFWAISDEIYSELTYIGRVAPSLSHKKYEECHDKLIILDGFSKFWAMTGWRLGYILGPEELMNMMAPVQQNFAICAPSISQAAAIHALDCEKETAEMLEIYRTRKDFIVKRINEIPKLSCLEPRGAFYIFANIKELPISSMDFSLQLLEKAHVATCPGISFGPNGEGYIRFSYPTDIKNIEIGMNRLEQFVKNNF